MFLMKWVFVVPDSNQKYKLNYYKRVRKAKKQISLLIHAVCSVSNFELESTDRTAMMTMRNPLQGCTV